MHEKYLESGLERHTTKVALPEVPKSWYKQRVQRILVIEDYTLMRRNLAVMLEMESYAVTHAA